jgi:hypothetical protein
MADLSLASLATPTQLRAFADAIADLTATSVCTVLRTMVTVLERQARQADDMAAVHRIQRLLQAVRAELDRHPHPVGELCADSSPGQHAGG